ncbi:MAG: hypothetical protein R6V36_01700, partial [Psychroflexus sp.]
MNRVVLILTILAVINLTTACQKQSKYDGDVKVEYTPHHVNLIRPIVDPERIYQMSIEDRRWEMLPAAMKEMKNLRELAMSSVKIQDYEASEKVLNAFENLEKLRISSTNLETLPIDPAHLSELKELNLIATKGYSLDAEIDKIAQLDSLEFLCVGGLKTDHLPEGLANLKNLKRFHFGYHAEGFDYEKGIEIVSRLPKLEHVEIDIVEFETIPKNFNKLSHIKGLGFYDSNLDMKALFNQIKEWSDLEMLDFN